MSGEFSGMQKRKELKSMNPAEFAEMYNELTGVFLHEIIGEREDGNVVFSPFSVFSLLSLLLDATGGKTREEILYALYGEMERKEFSEQLRKVKKKLTRSYPDSRDVEHADFSTHFHSDNAVCIREEYQRSIFPRFVNKLRKTYDGQIFTAADLAGAVSGLVSVKGGLSPRIGGNAQAGRRPVHDQYG